MSTSGYSSYTPEIELIKWAWLDILHTTDVFDVVFGSIPCFHPCTERANQGSALTLYNLMTKSDVSMQEY